MDIIKLIRRDHRTVKSLFRKFEKASAAKEKQALAEEIIEELSVHALVEEQLVYPVLRARDARLEDSVLEALEEHHVAKLTLAELDKMKAGDERFDAKMHVLRESIEMHIEEEEEKLLPRLERQLSGEELEELGRTVAAMKLAAPTHPHPLAPDTPPGASIAGALAKLTDAAKDLLHRLTNPARAEGHRRVGQRAKQQLGANEKKTAQKSGKAKTSTRGAGSSREGDGESRKAGRRSAARKPTPR